MTEKCGSDKRTKEGTEALNDLLFRTDAKNAKAFFKAVLCVKASFTCKRSKGIDVIPMTRLKHDRFLSSLNLQSKCNNNKTLRIGVKLKSGAFCLYKGKE